MSTEEEPTATAVESKQIFSLKSKTQQSKERYTQKATDYLEFYKMQIYLQDAIKIILDRKDEKPLDLLD